MFFNAGCDSEHIRVKNNILRREADRLGQDFIGTLANLEFTRRRIGLPVFVKSHDNHRRAIAQTRPRLREKGFLTLFQRNGINHRLALHAFQTGFNNVPLLNNKTNNYE